MRGHPFGLIYIQATLFELGHTIESGPKIWIWMVLADDENSDFVVTPRPDPFCQGRW
jgi:hypothetical protein